MAKRTLICTVFAFFASASLALAQGKSQSAPGQVVVPQTPGSQFNTSGQLGSQPGASGYAPGQQFNINGSSTTPGASGYAPGSYNPKH